MGSHEIGIIKAYSEELIKQKQLSQSNDILKVWEK